MLPKKEIYCHRTGFKKRCFDIVSKGQCALWMQVQGNDPTTGEAINKYGCADEWLPLLLMDNTRRNNEIGAAIESFRNEMVNQNEQMISIEGKKTQELKRLVDKTEEK